MSDEVRLVMPAEEDFRHIAQLVVGGLGVRLDLTYESLDDLQTGVEALLGCRDDDGDIVVTVQADGNAVRAAVGPFADGALDELEHDGGEFGLRRVLETVCDSFEIDRRDGAAWVELKKAAE
jgi:hypothetical protein